jgi:biopolymer transport protein ExbD
MGGGAPAPTGKGSKKPLDADLNLVPFIDLLCCCIAFLLITAVWTQMARIDVSQKGKAENAKEEEKEPKEEPKKLIVVLTKDGYILTDGGEKVEIPMKGKHYDLLGLGEKLRRLRASTPDMATKTDINVASEDGVKYDDIIHTMDACIQEGFKDIALSDSAAAGI